MQYTFIAHSEGVACPSSRLSVGVDDAKAVRRQVKGRSVQCSVHFAGQDALPGYGVHEQPRQEEARGHGKGDRGHPCNCRGSQEVGGGGGL